MEGSPLITPARPGSPIAVTPVLGPSGGSLWAPHRACGVFGEGQACRGGRGASRGTVPRSFSSTLHPSSPTGLQHESWGSCRESPAWPWSGGTRSCRGALTETAGVLSRPRTRGVCENRCRGGGGSTERSACREKGMWQGPRAGATGRRRDAEQWCQALCGHGSVRGPKSRRQVW